MISTKYPPTLFMARLLSCNCSLCILHNIYVTSLLISYLPINECRFVFDLTIRLGQISFMFLVKVVGALFLLKYNTNDDEIKRHLW